MEENEKKVNRLNLVRDNTLDSVNIKSVKNCYNLIKLFIIIAAISGIIGGFILIVFAMKKVDYKSSVNISLLLTGIATIILSPLASIISWIIIKPFIVLAYDIKMIKYKLIYDIKDECPKDKVAIKEEYIINNSSIESIIHSMFK